MNCRKFSKKFVCRSAITIALALCFAQTASAQVTWGNAAGFAVLTYNSSNNSDSAYQNGNIGVVNGTWAQSGGSETNLQDPETLYFASTTFETESAGNYSPALTPVVNSSLLNSAWNSAVAASSYLNGLPATGGTASQAININSNQAIAIGAGGYGTFTQAITLNGCVLTLKANTVGNYVIDLQGVNMSVDTNQSAVIFSAPAGSTFTVNISGGVSLNGGAAGGGLLVAGGIDPTDVVYNFTANDTVMTSGGNNAQNIDGTVLDVNGTVNLHPGEVFDGGVIAGNFSASSGAKVVFEQPVAIPEPGSLVLAVPGFALIVACRRKNAPAKRMVHSQLPAERQRAV